jgi:hypothetical protein|uniref:Uncharacterized protein n=1 Tax=Mus musculus TaxID=10090 RepID=Q3TAM6_MOUSE|nr:unnamed protein product [Mus musculus]
MGELRHQRAGLRTWLGAGAREASACACANRSPTLPPRPRLGLLRAPGPGLCARVLFSPFFPAHGNAAACVSFRALLVVGLGGGVFLPGPSLWDSEEITASCDKVKQRNQPRRAWRLSRLPRLYGVHMSV